MQVYRLGGRLHRPSVFDARVLRVPPAKGLSSTSSVRRHPESRLRQILAGGLFPRGCVGSLSVFTTRRRLRLRGGGQHVARPRKARDSRGVWLLAEPYAPDETGSGFPAAAEGGMPQLMTPPPQSAVEPVTEIFHGVSVTDPYRWLEDQNSPRTRAWLEEQTDYA